MQFKIEKKQVITYLSQRKRKVNNSRSEPGDDPRIGIGHREVVCQK